MKVKLNPEMAEMEEFPLLEVEPLTLLVLRTCNKAPFIVIKKEDKLYVTTKPIPFNYMFAGASFCGLRHRCSSGPEKTRTCPRLLALPDDREGVRKFGITKMQGLKNIHGLSSLRRWYTHIIHLLLC